MEGGHTEALGPGRHGAGHLQGGLSLPVLDHRRIQPAHPDGRAERLGQRLLGREPRGQRGQTETALGFGEQALAQLRRPLQGLPEPVDVHDVDPDADDHSLARRVIRR